MQSNQSVSKISSHQLNELVRLVVRMFINEVKNVEEMSTSAAADTVSTPMAFSKRKVKEVDEPGKLRGQFVNRGEVKLDGGLDYETASKIANYHWDIFGSLGKDERGVYNFKTRGDRFCCAVGMYQGKPAILSVTTTPGRLELLVGEEAYPSDSQNIKEAASGNTDPTREEMIEYLRVVYSGLLDRSSFDDAAEVAMYWFANFNHGGQSSNLYSVLSTSPYNPGRMENEPRPETVERDMFDALTREFGSENVGSDEDKVSENLSSPNTIYKDRQGGSDVYWIDNKDSGGKVFLKPEAVSKYLRKGYEIVDLADADSSVRENKKINVLVGGKKITLKQSVAPEYPFSNNQKKSLSEYFEKNQNINFDLIAEAMSKTLGKKISSKQLYGLYVESLMNGQVAEASKKKKIEEGMFDAPQLTFDEKIAILRKKGYSEEEIANAIEASKNIKPSSNIPQNAQFVPEPRGSFNEMTTTGAVQGYNVPCAFAKKGGSVAGVKGSEALGYTLTPAGKKEMQRSADKLLENNNEGNKNKGLPFKIVNIGRPCGYCKICWASGIHTKLDGWGRCPKKHTST